MDLITLKRVTNRIKASSITANLKPGKYIFWVRSSEILSNENDVGDSFIFEIQKPIYLRWYFIILYILRSEERRVWTEC